MYESENDEWCDPNNPRVVTYDNILAAARRIVGNVVRTPCIRAHIGEKYGMELYYKAEFLQVSGCFKERGVCNTLACLSDEQRKYGVLSASTGNHGLAMSLHATRAQVPCHIVMPVNASPKKMTKVREYIGNRLLIQGATMADAKTYAINLAKEKKMLYVNGYDHPNIIEGQGTIGIEILEQVPNVDAVLVPVGGGGLIAGIAIAIKHLKPDTEVYGIQTDKTYAMAESLRKNERVVIPIEPTVADGLAVNKVGVNAFLNIKNTVDKMIIVKEEWVMRAIMHIIDEEKLVVEGGGATTLAAIMAGLLPQLKGKRVVCVCSGGNMDPKVMARSIERAMGAEGRLVRFKVTVLDRPGGVGDLCSLLQGMGIAIRDIIPQRTWVTSDIYGLILKVVVETTGFDQVKELMETIKKHYKEYYFHELGDKANKSQPSRRGPCLAPNPVCMQK